MLTDSDHGFPVLLYDGIGQISVAPDVGEVHDFQLLLLILLVFSIPSTRVVRLPSMQVFLSLRFDSFSEVILIYGLEELTSGFGLYSLSLPLPLAVFQACVCNLASCDNCNGTSTPFVGWEG